MRRRTRLIQWDLKSDHSKSRNIWRLDFQMVGFSYGYSYSPKHSKTWQFKMTFSPDFKWFLRKWWPFVQISNGWASRSHQKSRLFATQLLFDHSKFNLVRISDPHWTTVMLSVSFSCFISFPLLTLGIWIRKVRIREHLNKKLLLVYYSNAK